MELLGWKYFRNYALADVVRSGNSFLEGAQHARVAPDHCRSALYLCGVLANMHIYFRSTSLFNTLVMLILLVGGIGLIARSIRPHSRNASN